MISISSLIYRSPTYADSLYNSLMATTPEIARGDAEFFFVANDPSADLLAHLDAMDYPFRFHSNPMLTEEELFARGIGWPEYMHRVYRAMNFSIEASRGDVLVFVSSDHRFTPGWLTKLLAVWTPDMALTPLTVEPGPNVFGPHLTGLGAVMSDCGRSPVDFDEDRFLALAAEIREDELFSGGVYIPLVIARDRAIAAGMYPEGNIAGQTFREVKDYGDRVFFRRLREIGVRHVTYKGSVVYHFNEGEKNEK